MACHFFWSRGALLIALFLARCAALHVVVAGATGKVGREVVRILARQSVSHVALTRDPPRAKRVLGVRTPCKCVDLDVADDGRLEGALAGDARFRLFVACEDGPARAAREETLLAAAAATGRCEHVVKLSARSPRLAPVAAGEAALARHCGTRWTALRASVLVETLSARDGPLGHALGADARHALAHAELSMISAADVGAVAARVLVADVPAEARTLELTGPAATTLAAAAARACESRIAPQPVEAQLAGLAPELADATRRVLLALAAPDDGGADVTSHAADVLGEPPRSADDVLRRQLYRRSMNSGSGAAAYNGRGAWTAKYRALLSFDEVRRKARSMGLRSRADWEDLGVPKYAPSRPQDMYPDEWRGWDDWLGTRRPYDDGRRLARTLGIHSELRWYDFAYRHPGVLEDLRLPFRPPLAYRADFRGWGDWLGLE